MAQQRVNFDSLGNGGDNPSVALRKLDGNCADLQRQVNDTYSKSGGKLNDGSVISINYGNVQWATPFDIMSHPDDPNDNYGPQFVSKISRGSSDQYGTWNNYQSKFYVHESVGNYVEGTMEIWCGFDVGWRRWNFRQDGNCYADGNWMQTSDRRLKNNLEKIGDALQKVSTLTGYDCDKQGQLVSTLIAQDVQAVLPRAVSIYGEKKLMDGTVIKDVLGLDSSSVVALLVNAVNELSDKVKALKSQISATGAANKED